MEQSEQIGKKVGNFMLSGTPFANGTFGSVYEALHDISKKKVAIKVIDKCQIIQRKEQNLVMQEVQILSMLDHPNILKFFDLSETKHNIYIITELIARGSLLDYTKKFDRLPENFAQQVFKQLASAVQYMHSQQVCHRDLKLENVIFDEKLVPKIIDFGFAKRCDQDICTECGSLQYSAPEVLCGVKHDPFKADVWSLGVILYAMLCGQFPFSHEEPQELKRRICFENLYVRSGLSESAAKLVKKMLEKDPQKRWSMQQIMEFDWVSQPKFVEQTQKICYRTLFQVKQMFNGQFSAQQMVEDIKRKKKNPQTQTYSILVHGTNTTDVEQERYKKLLVL